MNYSRYRASHCVFIVTQNRDSKFPFFVEKKEQQEMCMRKGDAARWTNHSCCGLQRCNMKLHFWRGAHQVTE